MAITALEEFYMINKRTIQASAFLAPVIGGVLGSLVGASAIEAATSLAIALGGMIGALGFLVLTAFVWGVIYCCKNRSSRNNSYGEVSTAAIPVASIEMSEMPVSNERMNEAKQLFKKIYSILGGYEYGNEDSHFFQMHWDAKVGQFGKDINGLMQDLTNHQNVDAPQSHAHKLHQLAAYCNLTVFESLDQSQFQEVQAIIQRHRESGVRIQDFEYECINLNLGQVFIICTPIDTSSLPTTRSSGGIKTFIGKLEFHMSSQPVDDNVESQRLTDSGPVFTY